MTGTFLTISGKNYSSWSLRGWLLCRMAGLDFAEQVVAADDPANRAELLLLSPSILVPCLTHQGVKIWDTLAIAEYLNEVKPKAGLLPAFGLTSLRYSAIASVSQILTPLWVRQGTRIDGDSSSNSAQFAGSSAATTSSTKSRPAILHSSQPRSDQEE